MLVNKEIARKLRDIGFNEPTDYFYNYWGQPTWQYRTSINREYADNGYSAGFDAPDKSDVFAWFRKKGFIGVIHLSMKRFYFIVFKEDDSFTSSNYETWEEAEDACILKMIELHA